MRRLTLSSQSSERRAVAEARDKVMLRIIARETEENDNR